jgi:hypothetical protein
MQEVEEVGRLGDLLEAPPLGPPRPARQAAPDFRDRQRGGRGRRHRGLVRVIVRVMVPGRVVRVMVPGRFVRLIVPVV